MKLRKPPRPRRKTASRDFPVGRLAGLHGLRGELKCDPTSAGRTLFSVGATFDAGTAPSRTVTLSGVREHKGRFLVTFDGVDNATAAQALVGCVLYVAPNDVLLDEGEHLDRDLTGCAVVDARDTQLGIVSGVEHYPTSDMLVVNGALLPMVRAFIASIDTDSKLIRVHDLPLGLLDPAQADPDS